jgi:tetratricopeptide (TPR) repeat protein
LDGDVLVVPPFDVLDPTLEDPWHEGLAQIVANNLDGAGPLTAVPPSVVFRRWSGTADAVTARQVAEATGAGLAVFGRLVGAGPDSVRLSATLFDVEADAPLAEFALRDEVDRVDRLADSLSVRVIGALSRIRPIGAARLSSLGSSSPQAVKEFLRGEQFYRRMQLDSARPHYERAIAEDSGFALAYNRLARVGSWSLEGGFGFHFRRAGALNHGLARRESLLLAADSLYAATGSFSGDSASWARFDRLFTTAEEAARSYPLDPQAWYTLGEILLHEGSYNGIPHQRARAAFTRAVELDSTFAPAYIHLIEYALLLDGPDAARRVAENYLARTVGGAHAAGARVVYALIDSARARSDEVQAMLDSLEPDGFYGAYFRLDHWPDRTETVLRLTRAWAASEDSLRGAAFLGAALSYRGHLREAYASPAGRWWPVFVELSLLGIVSADTADAVMASWIDDGRGWPMYGSLRWWAAQGDTVALDRAQSWFVDVGLPYATGAAQAYRSLAVGDSAEALRRLSALRTWPNDYAYHERLTQAQLLGATGAYEEALALLDEWRWPLEGYTHAEMVLWALERARLNEALGNRDAALEDFSYVLDVWRNVDPELQPYLEEARSALERLTGEPRE